jgi:hypothetical protein
MVCHPFAALFLSRFLSLSLLSLSHRFRFPPFFPAAFSLLSRFSRLRFARLYSPSPLFFIAASFAWRRFFFCFKFQQQFRAAVQSPVLFDPFFGLEWKHDAQISDCVQGLKRVPTQRPRKLPGSCACRKVFKKETVQKKTRKQGGKGGKEKKNNRRPSVPSP